jgi:flagellar basal body-associated protein FliL
MPNPNFPKKTMGDIKANGVCAEDALEDLRLNRTHTIPPGMRGLWVATKLQRLGEDHLSATDETTTSALGTEGNEESSHVSVKQHNRRDKFIIGLVVILVLCGIVGALVVFFRSKSTSVDADPTPGTPVEAVTPKVQPPIAQTLTVFSIEQAAPTQPAKPPRKEPLKAQPRPKTQTTQPVTNATKTVPPKTQGSTDDDEAIFKSR